MQWEFVAAAVDHYGVWGGEARKLFKKLANDLSNQLNMSHPAASAFIYNVLGATLARSNAACMLAKLRVSSFGKPEAVALAGGMEEEVDVAVVRGGAGVRGGRSGVPTAVEDDSGALDLVNDMDGLSLAAELDTESLHASLSSLCSCPESSLCSCSLSSSSRSSSSSSRSSESESSSTSESSPLDDGYVRSDCSGRSWSPRAISNVSDSPVERVHM